MGHRFSENLAVAKLNGNKRNTLNIGVISGMEDKCIDLRDSMKHGAEFFFRN
jgi:hypothetical protein